MTSIVDRLQNFAKDTRLLKSHSNATATPAPVSLTFDEAFMALEKGIQCGLLKPEILLEFQARPYDVVKSLRAETRQALGLPSLLQGEDLAKSAQETSAVMNFEDAYVTLEKGVHANLLQPEVLAEFQVRPVEVLKSLSIDMRKSLGLTAALPGESLSKSDTAATMPVIDWKAVNRKLEAALKEGTLTLFALTAFQNDPVSAIAALDPEHQRKVSMENRLNRMNPGSELMSA